MKEAEPPSPKLLFRPSFRRGNGAFTLIEMLVTIAVIVVLALLLIGAVGRAQEMAAQTQCLSKLRSIGSAILVYTAENDGILPTSFVGHSPTPTKNYWPYQLSSYLEIPEGEGAGYTILNCPKDSAQPGQLSVYGANYPTVLALNPGQSGATWLDIGARRLANLDPGTFLLADATGFVIYSPLIWGLVTDSDGDGVNDSNPSFRYNRVDFRHMGKANFLLLDGSMVSLDSKQWGENQNNIWGRPR